MAGPTTLKTDRLLLRPFELSDIDAVLEYASDPEWATYHPGPYDRKRAEYTVASAISTPPDKGAVFAMVYDGRVVGLVSLLVRSEDRIREAEFGYDLARDVWGRGLATEAASAICDWGFREYALAKIFAGAGARNRHSLRVTKNLGMTRESVLRSDEVVDGERLDSEIHSVLRSEWTGPGSPLPAITIPPNEWKTTERDDIPELTTPRLVPRPFRPGDVDDVFEYARDPEWAEFLLEVVPQPYTRRNAEEFIAGRMLAPGSEFSWAIVLEGACAGGITLGVDSEHQNGDFGYSLAKAHWGRGLMAEAARAVVDWGFAERGLHRISSNADVRNRRSWRVMEKLGMRREGLFRSHRKDPGPGSQRIDTVHYSLLREEWQQAAAISRLGERRSEPPRPPNPQLTVPHRLVRVWDPPGTPRLLRGPARRRVRGAWGPGGWRRRGPRTWG